MTTTTTTRPVTGKTRRTPAPSKSKTRSKQKLELLKARRSGVKTGLSDLV